MEMDNCNNPKTFLLCAWNYFERKEDRAEGKQYHWKKDCLVNCLATYFDAMGLREVKTEESAQIVVVAPRDIDVPLTLDNLFFFHSMLSKHPKKVLYVHQTAPSAFHAGYINKWCFFVHKSGFSTKELTKWIKEPLRESKKPTTKHGLDSWKKDLANAVDSKSNSFALLIKKIENDKNNLPALSRSGIELLKGNSVSGFYYGLLRLNGQYASLEHDLRRKLDHADDESLWKTCHGLKRFIDACVDLRSALTVLASKDFSSTQPNGVLLIDDRPDLIEKELRRIFSSFLPDLKLMVWNPEKPASNKSLLLLEDIERYTSLLSADLLSRKMKLDIWPENKDAEPKEFIKIFPKIRFVIVDILFKGADGRDMEKGYDVICGLHRIFRDFHDKLKEARQDRTSGREEYGLPEIIAISRSDDMDKAHAAFLKGAGGYVLKSRMLALPSALGRARYAALEPADTVHRNFRLLYNLPHETIGLLRGATISPVSGLPLANLLAAIPKADLHVHVGSCMSPEFLVVASLIMLLRHKPDSDEFKKLQKAVPNLVKIWMGKTELKLQKDLNINPEPKDFKVSFDINDKNGVCNLAKKIQDHLKSQITYYQKKSKRDRCSIPTVSKHYKLLRSILHKDLGLPDHLDEERLLKKLADKPDVTMFLFALTHRDTCPADELYYLSQDDLLRVFLLFMAANNYGDSSLKWGDSEVLNWFRSHAIIASDDWKNLHNIFYGRDSNISLDNLRSNNWILRKHVSSNFKIMLPRGDSHSGNLWPLDSRPDYDKNPIAYMLATGTRCSNLKTYLEGCEFSGAEHLRHPFLIHLYAQQTVHQFVNQGVMYAELRAAVSGYENRNFNFTFQDACNCLKEALQNAQRAVLKEYYGGAVKDRKIQKEKGSDGSAKNKNEPSWLWKSPFAIGSLFRKLQCKQAERRFPVKVSIILTGKRHKPTRQMLREAASATVLHTLPSSNIKTAQEFVSEDMGKCRLVGFDLAGQEDDYPPQLFRNEFEQISKMHIPITVHAGENASAGFVESAVLDLRARRIGHGLALAEDPHLMNRLREDGVCVELCPVSNFQTNQFVPAIPTDGNSLGREYPLRAFLDNGNAVCLNTDNPIISYTNMVKECFQASYAFGGKGLSLWELLRILRMGFVHSFLSLPERRSMLELADQILFDLFSDPGIVEDLRCMAAGVTVEGVIDHEGSKAGPNN
jgi:adenosine deaminase